MKRFFLFALALLTGFAAWSQESNLMIGAGLFGETGDQARNLFPGAVLRLTYGLDVRVGDKWSVMPGAGIRTQLGNVNMIGAVGGDMEGMSMADVFCQVRYSLDLEGTRTVLYLGPQFSYMVSPDTYYIDWDPTDPRNHKEKFLRWDVSLQPGIIFQRGKHWQWGIEASVGLRNMLRQYPGYGISGAVHLHNLMFICGWRF